jgi:ubiquinone/menaquinone biosynthesis C-methylase UbiE
MTDAQLDKAERLRAAAGFENVSYLKSYIENVRCEDGSFDAVISNGVINLAPDTQQVFNEAARLLRSGGRLAIADIVTEVQLPDGISCTRRQGSLYGGAMQVDRYWSRSSAGLRVERFKTIRNTDSFRSRRAAAGSTA